MLRLVRWSIPCVLLAAILAGLPVAGAAPLAAVPTPTATPPLPTATSTPGPSLTPRPTLTPSATPLISATPTPAPSATPAPRATPRPTAQSRTEPSPTPTGDPRLDKSVDPSSGVPGDTIVFTIVARNASSIPATGVVIDDAVPDVFEIKGATVSQGTVSVSGQKVHAEVGTIEPGGQVVLRITTVIRPGTPPGQVENIAVMTTSTPGDNSGNNTSTATVTILGSPTPTATPVVSGRRPPTKLPPTGDTAPAPWPLALLALLALLAGALLRARRGARRARA